ncbi:MAG: FAD-dependent oxidoreductase [Chloroflexi bacterium]|nr:MAG: FAD-dependent oxidoreductase [Chloroflexota bacterium]
MHDVLVVGSGFSGFWAAMAAKRLLADGGEVTLLAREPVLQIRPRLYEAHPEELAVDLSPLLTTAGVRFVPGDAQTLDPDRRIVGVAGGAELPYRRLVVATGSQMQRPSVLGADAADAIDTQAEALAFDRRLAQVARECAEPVVAVIGAGFTGIELALELRDRLALHGGEAVGERARIVLIGRSATVGATLGIGPHATIRAALEAARVELLLGVAVAALDDGQVTLADGRRLAADAVVLTTGMRAAPFAAQVPGMRDALGRVLVDGALQAPEAAGVFVTGDAAAADTGDGHLTLQSCQHALQLGRYAGENAARDLLGLPLLTYRQPDYVTCLDLGRSGAVFTRGWERVVTETGAAAKARKRRINTEVIYPPRAASRAELLERARVAGSAEPSEACVAQ